MVVGAAGDDLDAALEQSLGQHLGVGDDLLCIGLELGRQRFLEGDGLGGDDVHQRAALDAGEDGRVDLLGQILVIGEDHAAARAAQGLVRGRRCDMGVRERARIDAAGDEAGDMRHVDHQERADFVGDGAEGGPVHDARIGREAGDDQLGAVFLREVAHLIHIDATILLAHAVLDGVEPLAGLVGLGAVRQVAAGIEAHAEDGVAAADSSAW